MTGNSALKISTLGLSELEQQVLKVAINLLDEQGLPCELIEYPGATAHVLIASCDELNTQEVLSKSRNIPIKLLLSNASIPGKNIVSLAKPIRVLPLKDVLLKINKHLQKHLKRSTTASAVPLDTPSQALTQPKPQQIPKPKLQLASKPLGLSEPIVTPKLPVKPKPLTLSEPKTQATSVPTLATHLPPLPHANNPPQPRPQSVSSQKLTLFELIYNIKQQRECARLELPDKSAILVDSNSKTIANLDGTSSFKKLIKANPSVIKKIKVNPLEYTPVGTLIAIDDALWQAGIDCSAGIILKGHSLDKPVQLRAWPNFTRNSFIPCHLKLAAMLAKEALSLNQLQLLTNAPLVDIINFYNAAYGVGLIERRIRPREEEKTFLRSPTPRLRNLFSQLAKRLRIA